MRNNKAQAVVGIVIVVVLLIAVIGGGVIAYRQGLFAEKTVEDLELVATDCETAPSISVSMLNAINRGITVSVTSNARVDEEYVGTIPTTLQRGQEIEILVNASNYLDTVIPAFKVACGSNLAQGDIYATSTNTFRIFDTSGNPLTDSATGGATNQTTSASPISLDVKIDSTTDESTGDLVVVVEYENTTEVDEIKLSGAGASDAGVPEFYSPNSAGALTDAFEIPALVDGESKTLTLTLSPETGQTIGASDDTVYVTAYSKQWFVDTDGTFVYGVEDTDGTTKYEDTWDFDFMIT